jgi:hypothetical protein
MVEMKTLGSGGAVCLGLGLVVVVAVGVKIQECCFLKFVVSISAFFFSIPSMFSFPQPPRGGGQPRPHHHPDTVAHAQFFRPMQQPQQPQQQPQQAQGDAAGYGLFKN